MNNWLHQVTEKHCVNKRGSLILFESLLMNPTSSNTSSADPEIQRQYAEREALQRLQQAQGPRMVQRTVQQQDAALNVAHTTDANAHPSSSKMETGSDVRVIVRSDATAEAPLTAMSAVTVTREVINNAIRSNDLETLRRMLQSAPIDLDVDDEIHNLPLAEAARCGNFKAVQLLLNAGADVNAGKTWKSTALVQAVENAQDNVFMLLLEAGADIDEVDYEGNTLLMCAASSGNVTIVEELLRLTNNADVNRANFGRRTPLMLAAQKGHAAVFSSLVRAGADIQLKGPEKQTLLEYAAMGGSTAIIDQLLESGAEVNSADLFGDTALTKAVHGGHVDAYSRLLTVGAEFGLDLTGISLQRLAILGGSASIVSLLLDKGFPIIDSQGESMLVLAASKGQIDLVSVILEKKPVIDAVDHSGDTALMVAAKGAHEDVFELLIEKNARIDMVTKYGNTLLICASRGGSIKIVNKLLSLGVDIHATNDFGETALMTAAGEGNVEVFLRLLDEKSAIDAVDKSGTSLLMYAVEGGNAAIVRRLLSLGADINITDNDDCTPLQLAAKNGHAEVFAALIEGGATIDVGGSSGITLLMDAITAGSTSIVEKLLRLKIDVDVADEAGFTPLIETVSFGEKRIAILDLLLKNGANVNMRGPQELYLSATDRAISSENIPALELLLTYGGEPVDTESVPSPLVSDMLQYRMLFKPEIVAITPMVESHYGTSYSLLPDISADYSVRKSLAQIFQGLKICSPILGRVNNLLGELSSGQSRGLPDDHPFSDAESGELSVDQPDELSEVQSDKLADDKQDEFSDLESRDLPDDHDFSDAESGELSDDQPDESSEVQFDELVDDKQDEFSDFQSNESSDVQSKELSDIRLDQLSDEPPGESLGAQSGPLSSVELSEFSDDQPDPSDELMQALAGAGGPLRHEQKSMVIAGVLALLDGWVKSRPKGWNPYRRQGLSTAGEKKLTALVKLQAKKLAALGERAEEKLTVGLKTLLPKCAQYTQAKNAELVVDESRLMAYLTSQLGLYDQLAKLVAGAWFSAVNEQQEVILSSSLFQSQFDDRARESEAGQALLDAFGRALKQINSVEGRSHLRMPALKGELANLYSDLMLRQLQRLMQYVEQVVAPATSTH